MTRVDGDVEHPADEVLVLPRQPRRRIRLGQAERGEELRQENRPLPARARELLVGPLRHGPGLRMELVVVAQADRAGSSRLDERPERHAGLLERDEQSNAMDVAGLEKTVRARFDGARID